MNTFITQVFLEQPKLRFPVFRYGFLVFAFSLTIFSAITSAHLSPTAPGRYFGFIVPPMLLFNHLAFQFQWSRTMMIGLRIIAVFSCCVVLSYMIFVAFTK